MAKSKILGKLLGRTVIVEDDCYIGEDVEIISDHIHIKQYVTIEGLKAHVPEKFIVGECGYIGNNCTIQCLSFEVGSYLWMPSKVEIGRGGYDGPNSRVKIGNHAMICEEVVINPSESVTIGDDVGIGTGVHIWTHGSCLDITKGFPADFKPVKIGNCVWIPDRIVILPGVKIGNDIVIRAGSLVNKNLPNGCLAGGIPVEVLAKNVYPRILTVDNKKVLVEEIINIWKNSLLSYKNITNVSSVEYNTSRECIILRYENGDDTVFDINEKTIMGNQNDVSEDLRDFLRRRGIKIFTGKPFKSITPVPFL